MDKERGNKSKAVIRRVILCFLGLILGVSVYSSNASRLGGNQLPMPFGTGLGVVLSGSMEPELKVNDVIVVCETEDYAIGDVVVFQQSHDLIVHRIVDIDGDNIVTKGDANPSADAPITKVTIKGKVKGHIPFIGVIVNLLKTPACVVIVVVLAVLLTELSFRKEKDMDDKEIEAIKEEIRKLKEVNKD